MALLKSVGEGGANRREDVKVIQAALNLASHEKFKLPNKIDVDGKINAITKKAIIEFQKNVVGMDKPDGRVDPAGKTSLTLQGSIKKTNTLVLDSLTAIMAHGTKNNIQKFLPLFNTLLPKYQVNTGLRIAHFLAQVGHESASFTYTEEIASGKAYEGRTDLGNTNKGDGVRFKGRGLIQLTGRDNYSLYGKYANLDLLTEPNQKVISSTPLYALDVSLWFWNQKRLSRFADKDDIRTITLRVNGGLNGFPDRKLYLSRAKYFLV